MAGLLAMYDAITAPVKKVHRKTVGITCNSGGEIVNAGATSVGCLIGGGPVGCVAGYIGGKALNLFVLPAARKIISPIPFFGK